MLTINRVVFLLGFPSDQDRKGFPQIAQIHFGSVLDVYVEGVLRFEMDPLSDGRSTGCSVFDFLGDLNLRRVFAAAT